MSSAGISIRLKLPRSRHVGLGSNVDFVRTFPHLRRIFFIGFAVNVNSEINVNDMKIKAQALIIHRRQMRLRRNFPTEKKARKVWRIRSSSADATRMKTMQWRAALPLLCFFAMGATVHGQPGKTPVQLRTID